MVESIASGEGQGKLRPEAALRWRCGALSLLVHLGVLALALAIAEVPRPPLSLPRLAVPVAVVFETAPSASPATKEIAAKPESPTPEPVAATAPAVLEPSTHAIAVPSARESASADEVLVSGEAEMPIPAPPPRARPHPERAAPPPLLAALPPQAERSVFEAAPLAPAPSTRASAARSEEASLPSLRPRPAGGLAGNPKPDYPLAARLRHEEGRVLLEVEVAADGGADKVAILSSSGYAMLDRAAILAVKSWRFLPATRGGVPVAASVEVPIDFRMTD